MLTETMATTDILFTLQLNRAKLWWRPFERGWNS